MPTYHESYLQDLRTWEANLISGLDFYSFI